MTRTYIFRSFLYGLLLTALFSISGHSKAVYEFDFYAYWQELTFQVIAGILFIALFMCAYFFRTSDINKKK